MLTLTSFRRLNVRLLLSAALVAPNFARADQPPTPGANADARARISDEINRVEHSIAHLKALRETKAMSGRGWTALDDLVVGAAMSTAAAGVYALLVGLPRAFPNARLLQPGYLFVPKVGAGAMGVAGAMNLAQGAVVYPFVPKGEMGAEAEGVTVDLNVNHIDVDSLSLPQAEALLARLTEARAELDESTAALTTRLRPKLGSRLAFISSNVISTGLAVIAIGGGIYLVTSQARRFAPMLMRIDGLRHVGQLLADNHDTVRMFGAQQGFGIAVQGVVQTITGGLIRLFVPKGTPQASPVN